MAGERVNSIEMIRRLVGFDTVSARSNMALIDFVRQYLAGHGIRARLVPNPRGDKANLFAAIGPDAPGGVLLSGHTDVVPVDGQPWSSDPFSVSERDGRLYGRGTADMKSFIAVALSLAPEFKAMALKRPIYFAFSFDEEVGCLGAPLLIDLLGRVLPKPALAIVGEPTSMRVVNAHKGVRAYTTTIVGRDAHSSAPQLGANAILFMGRFIAFLDALAADLKTEGDRAAIPGLEFDPPWTTLGLGLINGGTALNIIARECRLGWEFRPLPGADALAIRARAERFVADTLLPELRRAAPEGSIVIEELCNAPALRPEAAGAAEALALRLTGSNRTATASFGSEAGQFQGCGISTVMCGPGDIAQAHQPDEFVALDQVRQCEVFLRRLADWAAS